MAPRNREYGQLLLSETILFEEPTPAPIEAGEIGWDGTAFTGMDNLGGFNPRYGELPAPLEPCSLFWSEDGVTWEQIVPLDFLTNNAGELVYKG